MNDILRIARLRIALQRAFLGQAILRVIKIYLARDKQQTIKSVSTNLATSLKKNNVNACAARFCSSQPSMV